MNKRTREPKRLLFWAPKLRLYRQRFQFQMKRASRPVMMLGEAVLMHLRANRRLLSDSWWDRQTANDDERIPSRSIPVALGGRAVLRKSIVSGRHLLRRASIQSAGSMSMADEDGSGTTSAKVLPTRSSSSWFVCPAALVILSRTLWRFTPEKSEPERSHPASSTGSATVSPAANIFRNIHPHRWCRYSSAAWIPADTSSPARAWWRMWRSC